MAASTIITRRGMLKAAPAVAVTAALPAFAGDGETDISRLWRQRNEALAAYRAGQEGATDPDAHTLAFCDAEEAIFEEIAAIEPTSARDYAIKMAAWFGMNERAADNGKLGSISSAMFVEIAKFAGITPEVPIAEWAHV